jgi:hypothetical protein
MSASTFLQKNIVYCKNVKSAVKLEDDYLDIYKKEGAWFVAD